MWKFLKTFFAKEEQAESVKLKPHKVSAWLDERYESKSNQLNERLNSAREQYNQLNTDIREKLSALQSAQLLNENVPEKHKQFAEGNKDSYIQKATRLLDSITFPETPDTLPSFFKSFEENVHDFIQSAARPAHILQEFFGNQMKELKNTIGKVEQLVNELKQVWQTIHLDKLKLLRDQAKERDQLVVQQEELNQQLAKQQEQVEQLTKELKKLEHECDKLNKDASRKELDERVVEIKRRLEAKESELRNNFSPLDAGLKKYVKIKPEHAMIVSDYMHNPSEAIGQDVHLKIMEILGDLQRMVWNNEVELKPDKKSKTIQAIGELSRKYLQQFITDYAKIKRDEGAMKAELEKHPTNEKLSELTNAMKSIQQELTKAITETHHIKKQHDKLNITEMTDRLFVQMNEQLDLHVQKA